MEVPDSGQAQSATAGGTSAPTGGPRKTKKAPQGTHNKINTKK